MYNFLKNYSKKKVYPFHMPGHKGNKNFFKDFDFLSMDVTEFAGTDNLHKPEGIILESQKKAAKIFGAEESFFIINGSSCGIIVSMLATLKKNDKIIVGRNCHKSFFSGLLLSEAKPIFIYPEIFESGIVGCITPKDVLEEIINNPEAKVVFITSPTYEGFCSDIKSISEVTKKYNKILIVDEAHGAHFSFSKKFPKSSVKYADIVIQSLHKTLPVLGQSSILHVNNNGLNFINEIKKYLSVMQTTSPSYLLMASIDKFLNDIEENKNYYNFYTDTLINYRKKFKSSLSNIELLDKEILGKCNVKDLDISKLVFFIKDSNMTGKELDDILSKDFGIQVEASDISTITALSSVCDTEEGFEKLFKALFELDKRLDGNFNRIKISFPKTEIFLSLTEAEACKKIRVKMENSISKISGEQIVPYPPGIPIINPGEKISKEIVDYLLNLKNNGIEFIGKVDNDFEYIYVLDV